MQLLSMIRPFQNFHRAFLEIRLFRDRVGGVQGHLVDQLAGIEPGHEDQARGAACCGPRVSTPGNGFRRAATVTRTSLAASAGPSVLGVVGMHEGRRRPGRDW